MKALLRYVFRRTIIMLPTLLVIILIVFFILHMMPNTPGRIILGIQASQEQVDQLNESLGYNDPLPVQYARYLWNAVRGDFGESYQFGRPVYDILLPKFPTTLKLAFFAMAVACALGVPTAYYGGKLDAIVMRFLDTVMCIPSLLLALTIVAVCGSGLRSLTIAITVASVPGFTRMVRSVVLSVTTQDFIEAARSCGAKDSAIIFGHIMPNAIGPIIVNCMMNIAGIIMTAAGLSYLGMGIKPPAPEWGCMLSEGMQIFRKYPHVALCAGVAIMVTTLCFNLVGDGLADAIDPKRRDR